ncbi:MAG: hypothetical protein AAF841_06780 [Pseudomonadota bacterium]
MGTTGNLEMIGREVGTNDLYSLWTDQTNGVFFWFGRLPSGNTTPSSQYKVIKGADGKTQVISIGDDAGQLYIVYQHSDGSWHNHGKLAAAALSSGGR